MSAWRPDSPVELPDGSLVCKAHGLVVCGICTVDYSFMQDGTLDTQDEDNKVQELEFLHSPDLPNILGYVDPPGRVAPDVSTFIPSKFHPPLPTDSPMSLFTVEVKRDQPPAQNREALRSLLRAGDSADVALHRRFVRRKNKREFLIFTDGACLNNGQSNPSAGCAFIFHPITTTTPPLPAVDGTLSFRLENKGPTGADSAQTSNRAELRAVIAALQFRIWVGEGWDRLVIATDSEYVVNGATEWVQGWERKGWVTAKKEPVKNRDLWELLLREIRTHKGRGLDVVFWRIPRELNRDADEAAKKAAALASVPEFLKRTGIMVKPTEMGLIEEPWQIGLES